MIASIGNDLSGVTGFFAVVLIFLVSCAASLTVAGRCIWRDALGWPGRVGGGALLAVGAGFWLLIAAIGIFGTIAVLDVRGDQREQVTRARRSCEASTGADVPSRKAEIKQCVQAELRDL